MSKRLIMMQAVALVIFGCFGIGNLSAIGAKKVPKKSYVRELEEAFAAKILHEKEEPTSVFRTSKQGNNGPGNKDVGDVVVRDIKSMLKAPYLDLLASSELATWNDVKSRFEVAKRATELFEMKYSIELKGGATTPLAPATPSVTVPSSPAPMPAPAPAGMPGPDTNMGMPAVTPPPPPAVIPAPAPAGMLGSDMGMMPPPPAPVPMGMPAVTPPPPPAAIPAPAGMPSPDMGMGIPGLTPPPLPAPAPAGMPGTVPQPLPAPAPAPMGMGGMPMM